MSKELKPKKEYNGIEPELEQLLKHDIITIKTRHKLTRLNLCPRIRPDGEYVSVNVRRVDDKDNMILSEGDKELISSGVRLISELENFIIEDGKVFDLTNKTDRAIFIAIYNPLIISSDATTMNKVHHKLSIHEGFDRISEYGEGHLDWYIDIPGQATKNNIDKKTLLFKAMSYVNGDTPSGRAKRLKVINLYSQGITDDEVLSTLLDQCINEPTTVINMYTGSRFEVELLIIEALDSKVLRLIDGQYFFGDKVLSSDKENLIRYLMSESNLLIREAIVKETGSMIKSI